MFQTFSAQLISDFKDYWLEHYGEDISDGQAEQYLSSLAELFLSFEDRQG